jgi:asparagine synthetase B (glutamine-hydrolysing)
MSHALAHRGPDGAGLVGLEGDAVIRSPESTAWQVAVAYRRLFIIDLTPCGGAADVVDRDRYWFTYNGRGP